MKTLTKDDLKLPALLLTMSLVPALGGIARLASLSGSAPDDARFLQAPLPILVHVISATLYCLLGAFQFSSGFRRRWPGLHRRAGRWLALCGLLSGATGFWMTAFYPIPTSQQGPLLYGVRLAVSSAMVASLLIAWRSILRRDVPRHEAFMIRAYALGQGAGTQVLVLLPWMLISGENGGFTRDLLMTLSWAINIVVAELSIRYLAATQALPKRSNAAGDCWGSARAFEGSGHRWARGELVHTAIGVVARCTTIHVLRVAAGQVAGAGLRRRGHLLARAELGDAALWIFAEVPALLVLGVATARIAGVRLLRCIHPPTERLRPRESSRHGGEVIEKSSAARAARAHWTAGAASNGTCSPARASQRSAGVAKTRTSGSSNWNFLCQNGASAPRSSSSRNVGRASDGRAAGQASRREFHGRGGVGSSPIRILLRATSGGCGVASPATLRSLVMRPNSSSGYRFGGSERVRRLHRASLSQRTGVLLPNATFPRARRARVRGGAALVQARRNRPSANTSIARAQRRGPVEL